MQHDYVPWNPKRLKFGAMKAVEDNWPANLADRIRLGKVKVPKTLNELTSARIFEKHVSLTAATELGFASASMSAKTTHSVFIQLFAQYKEIRDGSQKLPFGVGVYWIADIS